MITVFRIELTIKVEGIRSLKEKRGVISRIKTLVKKTYNAGIAESHLNDALDYIGITIALIITTGTDHRTLIDRLIERIEVLSGGITETEEIIEV